MVKRSRLEYESGLLDHLEELRTRFLVMIAVLCIGSIIGWMLYPQAYHLIAGPLLQSARGHGGQVFTLQPGEAFFTQCKLAIAIGGIMASPVCIWQLWAFIRPGLTMRERRAVAPLLPAISVLFILGVSLAYFMLPNIMTFFMGYVPNGVHPNIDYQSSINFPLKVMLAFGVAFQLPIVLIGLVCLQVLTTKFLLQQWRVATVIIGVAAAVLTPTGDPFNWAILAVPMLLLYFGSIAIASYIEHRSRKQKAVTEQPEAA